MTYEQKYGRPPDGFYQEEAPPEAWQFENPLVTVSKDGVVKNRLQKSFARPKAEPPKMRPISEILSREAEKVDFIKLDMDKQIKMVAEEYNKGTRIKEMTAKFGITHNPLYNRIERAREAGLITEMRGSGNVVATENETFALEDFGAAANNKRLLADQLEQEAERLEQASVIATALTELLGDESTDLVSMLYGKVCG